MHGADDAQRLELRLHHRGRHHAGAWVEGAVDWDKMHQLSLTARNLLDSESFLHFISKTVFVFALGSLKTIVLSFGHMSHFYNVKRAPFEAEKLNQS